LKLPRHKDHQGAKCNNVRHPCVKGEASRWYPMIPSATTAWYTMI